jgi:hypothetical protein
MNSKEFDAINCLPCQELASHSIFRKECDGANKLEYFCPKAQRMFNIYYSDNSKLNQSFIDGVVRTALSLCSHCKESQHQPDSGDN